MLAVSQSLQSNTQQRSASVFKGSASDMDEGEEEDGEGGVDVDDVGGGD
jgi:hypothetical protein